jgi:hypothetical protein
MRALYNPSGRSGLRLTYMFFKATAAVFKRCSDVGKNSLLSRYYTWNAHSGRPWVPSINFNKPLKPTPTSKETTITCPLWFLVPVICWGQHDNWNKILYAIFVSKKTKLSPLCSRVFSPGRLRAPQTFCSKIVAQRLNKREQPIMTAQWHFLEYSMALSPSQRLCPPEHRVSDVVVVLA